MEWLNVWWRGLGQPAKTHRSPLPRRPRLTLEQLEDRAVPASFIAANVADLVAHIAAANQTSAADTITLVPGKTFTLKAADNFSYESFTGLPVVAASGGSLTIVGNGDTIERRTANGTPAFRLFAVEAGATLTLENLTLQGGLASDTGGGIHNAGTLTLSGVTVQKNTAAGDPGRYAMGGGIYSDGSLTMHGCRIQDNKALGGDGYPTSRYFYDREWYYRGAGAGAWGFGGGVYVGDGTLSADDTIITGNTAKGGKGGKGKFGQPAAPDGSATGGGLYISAIADATLDADTVANVKNNKADNSFFRNIDGSYTIPPES